MSVTAPDVDREPEDEEEERREDVPEGEKPLLDLAADRSLRKHHARHQRPDRLGEAERVGAAPMPTRRAKVKRRKNSVGMRSRTASIARAR